MPGMNDSSTLENDSKTLRNNEAINQYKDSQSTIRQYQNMNDNI